MDKISEVQTTLDFNNVYEYYETLYYRKYQTKPIEVDQGPRIKLRQLVRSYGQEKVKALLNEYFTMANDWFAKKGHSLETFNRELSPISASLGQRSGVIRDVQPQRDIKIRIMTWCNDVKCKNWFPLDCWASRIHQEHGKNLCPSCLNSNALIPLQEAQMW